MCFENYVEQHISLYLQNESIKMDIEVFCSLFLNLTNQLKII